MNKRRLSSRTANSLLVASAMFLGLVGIAVAQSGGGYDLSWSTIDGGGHTWSTGNDYSLGGAIG
jgi:hypothetical protein